MSEILKKTREICKIMEIKPSRSKGQNFLINEKIYEDMVKAADLKRDDVVLEVGPGLGFLTAKLAKVTAQVIAVELDDKLANYLSMAISSQGVENVSLINQDILKFNLSKYFEDSFLANNYKYKIVANLPYNISSIFLRTFLSSTLKPESITLMLQKEVAQRIVSQAPDSNLLSLSCSFYGEAKIVREVKAGNFWPEPEVDSAIIKIDVFSKEKIKESFIENKIIFNDEKEFYLLEKKFFSFLKIAFSAKRKMIKNNLSAGMKIGAEDIEKVLLESSVPLKSRAEDLSLDQFKKLFATIYKIMI